LPNLEVKEDETPNLEDETPKLENETKPKPNGKRK